MHPLPFLTALLGLSARSQATEEVEPRDFYASENVTVSDLTVRTYYGNGSIASVAFLLSGNNATDQLCDAQQPAFPSKVYVCGDSKYRFALLAGETETYRLDIYHELGTAFGFYAGHDIFTYCHAGGGEIEACDQLYNVTFLIGD